MTGTVVIDCFPESAEQYKERSAIVAIDVIRATTTATTALAAGRRVFPARTTDEAFVVAGALREPLLVGELGGHMPVDFDLTNSPAEIAQRDFDTHRPMVLVSSSGTQLILNSAGGEGVYLACFRNYSAVAKQLAGRHEHIAVIGAGTRGQFRREDQIGCALVVKQLLQLGYTAENQATLDYVRRWMLGGFAAALDAVRGGKSADYLRKSNQERDLEFVTSHIDDLTVVPWLMGRELVDAAVWQSPELSIDYHQQHQGASVE